MIVVNFKTYPQATGTRAVMLAKICNEVSQSTHVKIIVVPQLGDLQACKNTDVECWSQHIDDITPGKNTGFVSYDEVVANGATGTLLNHSEHRLSTDLLKDIMGKIPRTDFQVCLCAQNSDEAKQLDMLQPNFLAYEPPELIGSRDKSVSTEHPEIIQQVVNQVKTQVLIGAGVHSAEDVRVGLKLGAVGILLATDVVLAEDPMKELQELAAAFQK